MPPKKTRGGAAAGSTQRSSQQSQRQTRSVSREPSQEPQQQRKTRKRKHSDAPSDLPTSQASAATPSKRPRRGKPSAEAEIEHELLREVIEEEDELAVATEDADVEMDTVITTLTEKHVHFGDGQFQDDIPSDDMLATATHITPHPRKTDVKRRVTASPLANADASHDGNRIRRSYRRSLPSALSQDDDEKVTRVETHIMAPVDEELRRLKKQKLRVIELREAEDQARQEGHMTTVEEIQKEMAQLIEELRSPSDPNMLVLASQDAVSYPDLPDVPTTPGMYIEDTKLSLSQSQSSQSRAELKDEVRTLKEHIMTLSDEANRATTKLNIFESQIQCLGFGDAHMDADTILAVIRDTFIGHREVLKSTLPSIVTDATSNEELFNIAVTHLQDFTHHLRTQAQDLNQETLLTTDLGKQVRGLLGRLAEAEIENDRLTALWDELDKDNDSKARELEELQDDYDTTIAERDNLENELGTKTAEAKDLSQEVIVLAKNIDRLTATLQHYRDEESKYIQTINNMEQEHGATVAKMNQERETTVRDLEDRLDGETQSRAEAEQLAQERQGMITSLELRKEETEDELARAREDLLAMTADRDQEQTARTLAENDLQERSLQVEDLEDRVGRLEDSLAELTRELDELRVINQSERQQREEAEAQLDARNVEVDQLNDEIREHGLEANELRQKIFGLQQQHKAEVDRFQLAASERNEQYQVDMEQEVKRRAEAEEIVQEREDAIAGLQIRLKEVEQEMDDTIQERDAKIDSLEQEITQKHRELQVVRDELETSENLLKANTSQARLKEEELEVAIRSLQATIEEHEDKIASLQEEAVNDNEQHNSEIAELNHDVAELRTQVEDLQREKGGLEVRVNEEAEEMLRIQNENADEIEALKATILDKQEKIVIVQEKARVADQSWGEVVIAKDDEIARLQTTQEEMTETIEALTTEITSTKQEFREYVETATSKLRDVQNEAAMLKALADQRAAELDEASDRVLQTLGTESVHTTVTTTKTQKSRKTRGSRGKRVVDSGIGMHMDGEEESVLG